MTSWREKFEGNLICNFCKDPGVSPERPDRMRASYGSYGSPLARSPAFDRSMDVFPVEGQILRPPPRSYSRSVAQAQSSLRPTASRAGRLSYDTLAVEEACEVLCEDNRVVSEVATRLSSFFVRPPTSPLVNSLASAVFRTPAGYLQRCCTPRCGLGVFTPIFHT